MMVTCVICNKEEGKWQCSVCGRMVGTKCGREIGGRAYCIDHIPASAMPLPSIPEPGTRRDLSGLVKAIWTVLFLTFGAGAILYVMQRYAASVPVEQLGPVAAIILLFQTIGQFIVSGLAGILVILIIVYAVLRRPRK